MGRLEGASRGGMFVALLASIGCAQPEPNTEQVPLWSAYSYLSGRAPITVTPAEPFAQDFTLWLIVPDGGSGGYTSTFTFDAQMEAETSAAWVLTLLDADGNELDEAVVTESDVEADGPRFDVDVAARDVLVGCEPAFPCGTSVTVELTPSLGTLTLNWQAELTARDNELGEDMGVTVQSGLALDGG